MADSHLSFNGNMYTLSLIAIKNILLDKNEMIPKYTHINIHYNTNDNFTMSYTKNNIPHNSNITRDILNTILPFLSADLDQDIIISNIRIPAIRTSYGHLKQRFKKV